MPIRLQRERTKGSSLPPDAVYVGRPSRWGNPFRADKRGARWAVAMYRRWLADRLRKEPGFLAPLRGKDLACWCPLDQPCHADILLEMVNR